jgi:hypothetical protein
MLRRDPDATRSATAPGAPPAPDRPTAVPPPRRLRPPLRPAGLAAVLLLAGLAAGAAACGGDPMAEERAASNGGGAGAAPSGQGPAGPPAGAPVGPLTSRGEPAPTPAIPPAGGAGGAGAAGRLVWELPAGWTDVPPASPMRMAQATIPGPGGAADLVLFHFGPGGGGGVQANIDRWIGQMEIEGEPERGSFTAGDLAVTWVDVAGTLLPSGMGMGPTEPQPGSRLLGAVVEGAGGPWFFKATGPSETLSAAREDFLGMLRAARVE